MSVFIIKIISAILFIVLPGFDLKNNLKKHPILSILSIVIGFALLVFSLKPYYGNSDINLEEIAKRQETLYRQVASSNNKENDLIKVNKIIIGDRKKRIETLFGIAHSSHYNEKIKETEEFYGFSKFYLQLIYDKDNKLRLYSVTAKTKDFTFEMPVIGKRLGKFTFYDLFPSEEDTPNSSKEGIFTFISKKNISYSFAGARNYGYAEHYYFGNPGQYKEYFFAYNLAGYDFTEGKTKIFVFDSKEKNGLAQLKEYRKNTIPNSYAVGDVADFSFVWSEKYPCCDYPSYRIGPSTYNAQKL